MILYNYFIMTKSFLTRYFSKVKIYNYLLFVFHPHKSIGIIFLFLLNLFPITDFVNILSAYFLLIISIMLLYKTRKNFGLFLMFLFIFYINYSISIGEFIVSSLTVPMTQVKTTLIYGMTLRQLLIFNLVFLLYLKVDTSQILLTPKFLHRSILVSSSLLIYIILIFLF